MVSSPLCCYPTDLSIRRLICSQVVPVCFVTVGQWHVGQYFTGGLDRLGVGRYRYLYEQHMVPITVCSAPLPSTAGRYLLGPNPMQLVCICCITYCHRPHRPGQTCGNKSTCVSFVSIHKYHV
ncbi:hypothetical protein BCR43DRAFT_495034 [Syncephalastrum racemosum]|uniref:Uncharacterized protein n=1 Tax=Syncephalastrum racemosum TaxID=13706 RepID=A0A1X2H904_SYNRA|nr:hypothetical protein BCR43DRAFT_495034 [Syncephalastrum racemosum]